MAASTNAPRRSAASTTFPPIPLRRRLVGLGSVYGKTIRDSRLSFIIAAGLLGGMALLMGAAVPTIFPTPQARLEIDNLIGAMPASMVNLFGQPVGLGTLGGYMTWKYGSIFVMGTALWSLMALSSTLATEARRGSLDMVATTPLGKRRIAIEKLAGHLTLLWLTMGILGVAATVGSNIFGDAALGDVIPLAGGLGFGLWIGSIAMFFGGLAFLLAPVLGRAGAAGISGIVMLVLWLANGVESMGSIAFLSPFRWTTNHIPLVGQYDWLPVLATAAVGVVFLAGGVALFVRRDLGVTAGLSLPKLPALVLGTSNPFARAFGDMVPRSIAWGIGLFLMGALLSAMTGPIVDQIKGDQTLLATFQNIFPAFDLAKTGGWLQLYAELMFIAFGFAGATFVAKWASDETEDRLEVLLATPMTRSRWVVAGGVAALLGTAIITILFAIGIGSGAAGAGIDPTESMLGTASLGLFTAAIIGIGFAIGGLWRTSIAPDIAALVVVATYLLSLLAPPLRLPDWVRGLALTTHLGEPMMGHWDPVGVIACLVIAIGGIALGAWGMSRRDVAR
jgi:ABC-2 type transport system permease protein